jgi:hypothetical protein
MKWILLLCTLVLFGSNSLAAELGAGLVPPAMQKANINFGGVLEPNTDFGDKGNKSSLEKGTIIASVPVNKTDTEAWTVSTLGHWLDLSPDQEAVPDLYQLDIGLTYTKVLEGGRMWALNGNLGSASDQPFRDSSVDTISGNYFYLKPSSETGTWMFLVNYSNNRPILNNIPIPGVAYIYTPSKSFRGTLGFPFAMVKWDFADRWTWNFFTIIPWVIKTSVDYSLTGPVKIYTGMDFSQSTYFIYGRENLKERMFYDEKKVFVGIKSPLSKDLLAELDAGYAFDRRYFSAETYERSPDDAINLGTSPYLRFSITTML